MTAQKVEGKTITTDQSKDKGKGKSKSVGKYTLTRNPPDPNNPPKPEGKQQKLREEKASDKSNAEQNAKKQKEIDERLEKNSKPQSTIKESFEKMQDKRQKLNDQEKITADANHRKESNQKEMEAASNTPEKYSANEVYNAESMIKQGTNTN